MDYSDVLEKYLYRIARGELGDISVVLPLLLKTNVHVIVSEQKDEGSKISLKLKTLKKDQDARIPVFLDRSRASQSNFATGNQIIELNGNALLASLPKDCGLLVEPKTSLEVDFPFEMINDFYQEQLEEESEISLKDSKPTMEGRSNEGEYKSKKSSSKIRYLNSNLSKTQILNAKEREDSDFSFNLFGHKEQEDLESYLSQEAHQESKQANKSIERKLIDISKLEDDLRFVCSKYPSIGEVYVLQHSSEHSECVIGVLTDAWNSEDRFSYIEEVAEISQDIFGYAGAIEVYDDLNDTHSASWDFFKMMPPFYTKEMNSSYRKSDKESNNPSISSKIEIENYSKSVEDRGNNKKGTGSAKESGTRFGKTGFRIFGPSSSAKSRTTTDRK